MSKDWHRAVLAGFVALSFVAATGSAKAQDALTSTTVFGVGVDHTQRARIGAAQGWFGAVEAIDSLNRPLAQPLPARAAPQGVVVARPGIGGLRGLAQDRLDAASLSGAAGSAVGPATALRAKDRPMPYIRFGEGEQVFGFSFKIQPPPQAPELPTPRS